MRGASDVCWVPASYWVRFACGNNRHLSPPLPVLGVSTPVRCASAMAASIPCNVASAFPPDAEELNSTASEATDFPPEKEPQSVRGVAGGSRVLKTVSSVLAT